jgi:hypothetical protein
MPFDPGGAYDPVLAEEAPNKTVSPDAEPQPTFRDP